MEGCYNSHKTDRAICFHHQREFISNANYSYFALCVQLKQMNKSDNVHY